ncbi:uncharacterized protein NECHADRAFT_60125 [Fusarium vanettenii 77-13-4]|uniref:Cell wall proline rich protein n=1 Tax=Fusarium vanettenii (strain ATCC MYA-4622 / CBS 123669 / FGSC 9596 / NRRL 45880 / 77-13-4) TaxID=660122 RepID=C7YQB3_FUSV7|nr:uncharacterized protein NECHADRAFT_60125 [Fusarium vanettenii 77-13-4]EEU46440.1 hypothetical protein NECHADRAFT_60125 [Fusarium vanettenii 77-13-4]
MATTFGPEQLTRPSAGPAFDNPADRFVFPMDPLAASPSLDPESRADPPPNPPFVFPAQPPASAPSSFSRATGRRPMSAIETPNFSFGFSAENAERQNRSALPDFSFNPGALLPPDPQTPCLLTPPVSPRNIASPQRPGGHGHRRGGSEFVGGRLREGNSIAVMSTSPTKSESGFMTPTFQPPRRGHRRGISGAISTNDLPILQAPVFDASGRGSSAPTSPTGYIQPENSVSAQLDEPMQLEPQAVPTEQADDTKQPASAHSSPKGSPKQSKAVPKARVGFSDTLEFIPRPLSLVSNETSSTVTARPGHSVSGSISSIVSAASPSGRDSPVPLSRTSTRELTDSRPSTAGAILERTQDTSNTTSSPKRRNSIPTLLHLAEASKAGEPEPSPTKVAKRWSFFASTTGSSPTKTRPHSSSSSDSLPKPAPGSEHGSDAAGESLDTAPAKQKKSKKGKKKKKKVKGWAGAILPRKPKSHTKRSKSDEVRPPTPPASSVSRDDDDGEMYEEPELLEPSIPSFTVTESPNLPAENDLPRPSDETTYPMIDLDAALGPFNTPLPLNPEWEAAQRAAGNTTNKRRLHSAQGMKGFTGPGMHYHRRAESAPDLPPFDPGRAGMHRYNSSSTMADVFEEDEEDESKTPDDSSEEEFESDSDATPPAGVTKDPLLDVQDKLSTHSSAQSMRRTSSSLSDKDQITAGSVRAERSKSSLHDSVIVEEELPSVIFRSPFAFPERNDNADSAPASLRRASGNKDLAPVDIGPAHLPTPTNVPNSPYAMSHSSSFPSPRSPMSVEVQRISTAPSSVADENNFQSLLLMGEPGPERMSQPILREPRPVSVSSAAFGRRRSSLASLSRLISSSHGERSKLSMEVTLDNESTHKKSKSSRTKRLSRMMQFWKPTAKEGSSKQ